MNGKNSSFRKLGNALSGISGLPLSLILVCLAALFRAHFLGSLGTDSPFLTFHPAVMTAALLWGFPAGILATLASCLIADYYWIEPAGQIFN